MKPIVLYICQKKSNLKKVTEVELRTEEELREKPLLSL